MLIDVKMYVQLYFRLYKGIIYSIISELSTTETRSYSISYEDTEYIWNNKKRIACEIMYFPYNVTGL